MFETFKALGSALLKWLYQIILVFCIGLFGWTAWVAFTGETTLSRAATVLCGLGLICLTLAAAWATGWFWKNAIWSDLSQTRFVMFILFWREFGFFPRETEAGPIKKLAQAKVEARLKELAKLKADAEGKQSVFLGRDLPVNSSVWRARNLARQLKQAVDKMYDRFWSTWNLAKSYGFKVDDTFQNYLRTS